MAFFDEVDVTLVVVVGSFVVVAFVVVGGSVVDVFNVPLPPKSCKR